MSAVSASGVAARRKFDRHDWVLAVGLAATAFVAYNSNFHFLGTGDTRPARNLPFAVLWAQTFTLDPVLAAVIDGQDNPYWVVQNQAGKPASLYPIVTPLLITPLQAPLALWLAPKPDRVERLRVLGRLIEKVSAAALAACAAALSYLTFRRHASRRWALVCALAFAFATNQWATSSQALWQQGTAALLLIVALLIVTGPASRSAVVLAGVSAGLLAANRPPDAVFALVIAVYALAVWAPGRRGLFLTAAAIPCVLVLVYNIAFFGHLTGGYSRYFATQPHFFANPIPIGVAGMLVSPGKGLFVFAPFLLAVPLLGRRLWRLPAQRLLLCLLTVAMLAHLCIHASTDWRGGYSYGPRYAVELLPPLMWMLSLVVATLRQFARMLLLVALLFSTGVQVIGTFFYKAVNEHVLNSNDYRQMWQWRNCQFVAEFQAGPTPLYLGRTLRRLLSEGFG